MVSTITSSLDFQSILDAAFDSYTNLTGIDLTTHPSAPKIQSCQTPDAVLQLLQETNASFRDYRDRHRRLFDLLLPVVQVVHAFSGALGEAGQPMSCLQPTKAIFVGIDVLLVAALGVSASYDALLDLFECVGSFLNRLQIHTQKIPFSPTMAHVTVKIMTEVLSVLALATKQIEQGRFKKFAKKLLGEREIEAVLQRLDRLTQDEARMTLTQTLEVVHGLVNNVKVVMDDGKVSTDGIRQALVTMQEIANDMNKIKRDQLQRDIRSWLSPPDPSGDHIGARRYYHDGTATWFTHGSIFEGWKTTGTLLWIHGKPGSGKTVLCSTIIQEVKAIYETGLALMAYFYCSFTAKSKQDIRGLLTSLIAQLCAKSDPCYNIISTLYSRHNAGSHQPGDDILIKCLKDMLQLPGQPMIYLIVDAVDECPNSGIVSPREQVLKLLRELVRLRLANLRICLTSRPEADIIADLTSLASHTISLHDECGQKADIANYVRAVVYSDRYMRRWSDADKELVINILSEKAHGMFRWAFCQLETLRHCYPANLQDTLLELPESLDDTYKRTLSGIERAKREFAYRLFQCLTVSNGPLRVEELADLLAIRFDSQKRPIYHVDFRLKDAHEAVLSTCSSLIAIVNVDDTPMVQFAHFSVKEYLISDRLATAGPDLSPYHVDPQLAHTMLAQVSLSVLLGLDKVDKKSMKHFPLAIYAAWHWVAHAQFEDVSASIENEMDRLFDPNKPYFATWVWIYDIDYPFREHMFTDNPLDARPEAVPLYYATLCGFYSLAKRIILKYPRDVNARGGYHATPFHAALAKGNTQIALLLLHHGADINALDNDDLSPLHKASRGGRCDVAEFLIEHHANVNKQNQLYGQTPLHLAACMGELEVTRVLLEHDAAVDPRSKDAWTPLMAASRYGHLNVVRLLLQKGAAVDSRNDDDLTPLMLALRHGHLETAKLLLDHSLCADIKQAGETPLDLSLANKKLEHLGADSRVYTYATPPDTVSQDRSYIQSPPSRGQDSNVPDNSEKTSLHIASEKGDLGAVRSLLDNGADVNERDKSLQTPLHVASREGKLGVAKLLIKRGADVNSRDKSGWTPLHKASRFERLDIAKLLLDHDADVDAQKQDNWTPLHLAVGNHYFEIVNLLLERRAKLDILCDEGWTPHDVAVRRGAGDIADLLSKKHTALEA